MKPNIVRLGEIPKKTQLKEWIMERSLPKTEHEFMRYKGDIFMYIGKNSNPDASYSFISMHDGRTVNLGMGDEVEWVEVTKFDIEYKFIIEEE